MEDESNCRFIAALEGAIPQLILMGLTDDEVVVEQACKVIGRFPTFPTLAALQAGSDARCSLQV